MRPPLAGRAPPTACQSLLGDGPPRKGDLLPCDNLTVPKLIDGPAVIQAAGTRPKRIEEFAGRVRSGHAGVSVARMQSPPGWEEPGQRPEFEEITIVLRGAVRVEHEGGVLDVRAGQAVVAAPGEWVRYSTPAGAEYIAVCLPAFSPQTVHRDK